VEWLKQQEHLPSKCGALSSNPSADKKKKKLSCRLQLNLPGTINLSMGNILPLISSSSSSSSSNKITI
jgi:hypothetical protein